MSNVYNFIENLNINNQTIVAAISGGPDSMLLLDTLISLREKLNIKIVVAHVHHNVRKESDEEALYVEKYCKDNNVIFEMMKIENYPNNKFTEESARKIRYDFFDKVVSKYNSDILFTAHHGDDLIETILMRLTRGSTLKGYAGFEAISIDRGYKIARPLIYLTKKEIMDILDSKHIKYVMDMSNESVKYTRNRYRKKVLPELKKDNKNVHLKFIDYSNKLLLVNKYIEKEVDNVYEVVVVDNEIIIEKFNELDDVIKMYLLERYLKEVYGDNITDINNVHISLIIEYLKEKNNSKIDLPNNRLGLIEYNKFKVISNLKVEEYDYTFTEHIELPNGKKILVDNSTKLTTNYVIHLNSNNIKLPFHVRTKLPGDRMIIKNMKGSRKVSDIFTDFKLSKEERDTYPIVTDATGEIIWIPGIKKSHLDRKNDPKCDIILKYE